MDFYNVIFDLTPEGERLSEVKQGGFVTLEDSGEQRVVFIDGPAQGSGVTPTEYTPGMPRVPRFYNPGPRERMLDSLVSWANLARGQGSLYGSRQWNNSDELHVGNLLDGVEAYMASDIPGDDVDGGNALLGQLYEFLRTAQNNDGRLYGDFSSEGIPAGAERYRLWTERETALGDLIRRAEQWLRDQADKWGGMEAPEGRFVP